ncbi:MAG: amino acid adenylation domain-containing protein [Clostridia bacterium]|nr:amino acid adenylation domain-containing protein [Clostridia bacterium]
MPEENIEVDYYKKPIDEFISYIESLRIKLWVEDNSLRYKAPTGVATKEILKCLSDRKPEVMEYLDTKNSGDIYFAPIKKLEGLEYYPLSAAQLRMFLLGLIDSQSTAYNLTQVMKIDGEIDKDQVYEILTRLIGRHESLRTSFEIIDGKPVQKIHDRIDFNIDYEETENVKENIDLLIKKFVRPYDLSKPPLLRFKLVKLIDLSAGPAYLLFQDMHHIISDGISEAILVKEVNALFAGKTLPELKIQYKDYADWHSRLLSSKEIQIQKKFWVERLKDELPLLNLPTDYNRPQVFSFHGDSLKFQLERELSDRIHAVARENRVTLFTVLLAAYSILLSKYTGQDDMVIGTPTAGRRHADTYNIIGVFINMLALKVSYRPEKPFNEFLKEMGLDIIKAFDNQDYPFEQLVEDLNIQRDLSRNPVFDTTFNLLNMDIDSIKADGIEISGYEFNKNFAQYDMTLNAIENRNGIQIEINYCTSLFNKETIERLGKHYISILEWVTKDAAVRLKDIEMLSPDEKELVLNRFNETAVQYDKEKVIQELFEEQVKRTPDNTALVFGDKHLTYAGLNSMANSIAARLRQKGVKSDSIVGIMVERSFEMIAGIMGILKSGGAYLPIDPEYPADRISYMIEDSDASVLLTTSRLKDKVEFKGELVLLDDEELYRNQSFNPEVINKPEDLAYVIYTSGSTGKPKGVMIEHKALNNFICGMTEKIEFTSGKSILALTTICFDIFALETHVPLTKGMKVVIANESEQMDSKLLGELIVKNGIDMIQMTPSRMQLLMSNRASAECLMGVKDIIIGGEAFPEVLLKEISSITSSKVYNVYGPTETTVWSTIKDLTGLTTINIGKPIANTQIYIMDKQNKLQPLNVIGELWIGGDGLARGYLRRPELTAEKFVINPYTGKRMYKTGDLAKWTPDGEIKIAGRVDHQVKIRGYRVELEEIEKSIMGYGNIDECVVIARDDSMGNKYLAAYYVSSEEVMVASIRTYLSGALPEYMVPGVFVRLERLPRTQNGKIDRKSLPEPEVTRTTLGTEYIEPESNTEKTLEGIWKQLLNIERIGVNDNFFDIGGNSLLLVRMHGELEKNYPGKISVAEIFAHPTVHKLADLIDREEGKLPKDFTIETLQIPLEYFVCGNENSFGTVIRFKLDEALSKSLIHITEDIGAKLMDILLGAFVYLLYEVSEKQEIPLCVMRGADGVLQHKFDLGSLEGISDLVSLAGEKLKTDTDNDIIPLEHLTKVKRDKDTGSALLLFAYNLSSLKSEYVRFFDIILKAEESNSNIKFAFEYDSNRIRKEKVEELVYYYINTIEAIIERMS